MIRRVAILLVFLTLISIVAFADAADPRYCGAPKRAADGTILRSSAMITAFKRAVGLFWLSLKRLAGEDSFVAITRGQLMPGKSR